MRKSWRIKNTTLWILLCIAFLSGLGFARTHVVLNGLGILLASCIAIITVPKRKPVAIAGVLIFGFVLGWWRGQVFLQRLVPLDELQGKHLVATVRAESDAVYDERKQLSFDANHLHVTDPKDVTLPGMVAVTGFGEPAIYKGDIIEIEGKVFVSRGSRQMRMSFASLKVLGRTSLPIDTVRRKFAAGMETALPEPLASFGLGLLIGQRTTLPETVTLSLATVGLTHIIAVSGYNLTIIMRAVRRVLRGRSKYQTAMLSLGLIVVFLLATGMSASIIRASLVSGLSLLAWYYGRAFKPLLLILFVAALTAGFNPFYIWSDIGWYLSFLAFFGVLVLAPLVNARLFGSKQPKTIRALLIETICALIMTIPFILFIFNQISLIALFANLLIVPLVPLGMLLALIAGLAGMAVPIIAGVAALPARILLTYMLDLVQLLSQIPHIFVKRNLSLAAMLFLYSCLMVFALALWHRVSKNVKITDEIS